MQKVLKHAPALLRRVIWLGMGLQVLAGMLWLLGNMGVEHAYGMDWSTAEAFSEAGGQWGVLYPLILKIVVGMAQWLPIPYYCIMYFLQLTLALVAGGYLLYVLTGWNRARLIWGAMILTTVPMVLQGHLAVLPYSVTGSLVLLELAVCIQLCKGADLPLLDVVQMYVYWILSALCMREYLWIGMLPVIGVAAGVMLRTKENRKRALGAGLAMVGITVVIGAAGMLLRTVGEETAPGWKQQFTARCLWSSSLQELSAQWPEELVAIVGSDNLNRAVLYPEVLQEDFFEGLQQLDEAQQDAYLDLMLASAWGDDPVGLLRELAYDGVGYLFPGIMMKKQLSGQGFLSLTGLNYWYWTEQQGSWSGMSMRYYCQWFWVAAVLALAVFGMRRACNQGSLSRCGTGAAIAGLVIGLGMALAATIYYVMTGIGSYDYKLTAWWSVIWCVGTLWLIKEREEE